MVYALLFFGVLLPAITLGFEWTTGECGSVLFDPIPTYWHFLAVLLVPTINLTGLALLSQPLEKWSRRKVKFAVCLYGIVLPIAAFYSVFFLPISPLAVIAIVAYGFGLLPLSPILAFIVSTSFLVRVWSSHRETFTNHVLAKSFVLGGLLGVAILGIPEIQNEITNFGLRVVERGDEQRRNGLWILRNFGSANQILRQCYGNGAESVLISSRFERHRPESAREAYFAVTGAPFSSAVSPWIREQRLRGWLFDADLGGTEVAGQIPQLSLDRSEIEAEVDSDARLAHLLWTMEFQNERRTAEEARAQIQLPPDAVVSRLTLWVNGEPQEAAFSKTATVRAAYQSIAVDRRRDPVLVTWKSKNKIMMQCFPVPAGGKMKIRIGITTPFSGSKLDELRLPCLVEQNFQVRKPHQLWANTNKQFDSIGFDVSQEPTLENGLIHGQLSDSELRNQSSYLRLATQSDDLEGTHCFAELPGMSSSSKPTVVEQKLISVDAVASDAPIILVIDGSIEMRKHVKELARYVDSLRDNSNIEVFVAGDEVIRLREESASGKNWKSLIHSHVGHGGCENLAALEVAVQHAAEIDCDNIVWVHGTQPVAFRSLEVLSRRLKYQPWLTIHDLAASASPNKLVEELDIAAAINVVTRYGSVAEDLEAQLDRLTRPPSSLARQFLVRDNSAYAPNSNNSARDDQSDRKSPFLVDLWAHHETLGRLSESKYDPKARTKVSEFAANHHLVTPVSGAVVLETKQQYDEFGLKQVGDEPTQTLTTPEPASSSLLAMGLFGLLDIVRRRRRLRRHNH